MFSALSRACSWIGVLLFSWKKDVEGRGDGGLDPVLLILYLWTSCYSYSINSLPVILILMKYWLHFGNESLMGIKWWLVIKWYTLMVWGVTGWASWGCVVTWAEGMCMHWERHKTSLRRTKVIRLHTSLPWSKSILHLSTVQKRIQVALGQREIHSVQEKAGIPNTEVSIAFMHTSKTQPLIKHSWCQANK